jgi:hypothetical protein
MLQGMTSFAIAVKLWPRIGNRERMDYELSHKVPNGREPNGREPNGREPKDRDSKNREPKNREPKPLRFD